MSTRRHVQDYRARLRRRGIRQILVELPEELIGAMDQKVKERETSRSEVLERILRGEIGLPARDAPGEE
jgi:hypothetical protein